MQISALEWNQDEEYGGFGGPHCMVVGGYGCMFSRMASLLDVRLSTPVTEVRRKRSRQPASQPRSLCHCQIWSQ